MHNAVAACAFASLRESSFRKPYFSFKVRETCLSLLRKKVPAFAFRTLRYSSEWAQRGLQHARQNLLGAYKGTEG